ncbi:MAG: WYL domain-containing transcriptional regulator [Erysipelotrichaceae bacterium]|jgi:predicted DNA-binding transcriptional regulator YafY|nr:WYL domain-containing transcriptional regulator [Erysipelotrichaceae bacterium]
MENTRGYTKFQLILRLLSHLYMHGSYVKSSQISETLGINSRGVRRLVVQLRELGYQIESLKGKDGGYRLLKKNLFLPVQILPQHQEAFDSLYRYTAGQTSHPQQKEWLSLLEVLGAQSQLQPSQPYTIFSSIEMAPEVRERIEQSFGALKKGIEESCRVHIVYQSLTQKQPIDTIFDPYQFQIYNNTYYVRGYYHQDQSALRTLRLSRFVSAEVTPLKFAYNPDFPSMSSKLPFSPSFFVEYDLELKIDGSRSDIRDYIYGQNQSIEDLPDGSFILRVKMSGLFVVLNFILSLGASCEVRKPLEIRERLKQEVQKLSQMYY